MLKSMFATEYGTNTIQKTNKQTTKKSGILADVAEICWKYISSSFIQFV